MRILITLVLSFSGALAHARAYYVYDGRVVMGRRSEGRVLKIPADLSFADVKAVTTAVSKRLARLRGAFLCELAGYPVLVGVNAATGEMISRFEVAAVAKCRPAAVKAMLSAN